KVDGLEVSGVFSWMSLAAEPASPASPAAPVGPGSPPSPDVPDVPPVSEVGWLPETDLGEVAALLAADAPGSYATPDDPGVRRWAVCWRRARRRPGRRRRWGCWRGWPRRRRSGGGGWPSGCAGG